MPNSESEMIRAIRERAMRKRRAVAVGIGDDCAVMRPRAGEEWVVTTDLSLEGTHFLLNRHEPRSVGHRCLARGLSDVAAMGARPLAAFLSLAAGADTPQKWIDEFLSGFLALADRYQTTLAGGDISQSQSGIVADVMVIGSTKRGRAVLRSTARPNDIIYVTGTLGGSAATLDVLLAGKEPPRSECAQRHFFPEPRLQVGDFLAKRKLARAMIDCSDGLSTDLGHICEESGVGAILNRDLIPVATCAALEQALHGGEDYELIFTASPKAKIPVEIDGVPITEIGWITRERGRKSGVYLTDLRTKPQPLEPRGWQHFRNEK
ncbi:MAG TPA: thiamine-phosphate kinase [Terriglobales bacterium]|nr:thiamine-phosphate kinase [Terriglobales bacterium]